MPHLYESNIFAVHSQVQSGGLLQATPHCVRAASGPAAAGVARNVFAVFMQPRYVTLIGSVRRLCYNRTRTCNNGDIQASL